MNKTFSFYKGQIELQNGPGCYKITEDPLWLLSVLPLNKSSYLEVGCATGIVSLILKLKKPEAKIKAIDIQSCMIKQAEKHAEINNIKDIKFVEDNLFSLDSSFKYDCVFSNPPFFDDSCCQTIKDEVKGIAYMQKDINSFILKQLDLVADNGVLCFMGHISTRDDILMALKGRYCIREIALVSALNKPAKRFIYTIEKGKPIKFKKIEINSFDKELRNDILFLFQSLTEKNIIS